jgi:hypothetical protein
MTNDFYSLDVDKILKTKLLPPFVTKAAYYLREAGYLTAGEYFEKISDLELIELAAAASLVRTKNFKEFEVASQEEETNLYHLTLLCFLLAVGEGELFLSPEDLHMAMGCLFTIISVEVMYRKGQVEIYRENYSLMEPDLPIAKTLDKGTK